MIYKLYHYFKKVQHKNLMKKYKNWITVPKDNVLCNDFSIRFDVPDCLEKRKYLQIGHEGIVGGNYIFETFGGKISIGDRCHIGEGTSLISKDSITIGDDVIISWNCTLYDHNSHSIYDNERINDVVREYKGMIGKKGYLYEKDWSVVKSSPIVIKDRVWIGMSATILKGVTIGEGAVVAAHSVVVSDVEPYTVVGGNPARVIKRLK